MNRNPTSPSAALVAGPSVTSNTSKPVDRTTFFLGILLAAAVLIVGYYLYTKMQNKDASQPQGGPAERSHEDTLSSSPFIVDAKSDGEAVSFFSANGKPKVVLVHAPWCGHCRTMMGSFEAAASKEPRVQWVRIDANVSKSVVNREDLKGYPTVYGITSAGSIRQHNGARDANSILSFAASLGLSPVKEETFAPSSIEILPEEEEKEEEEEEEAEE